MQQDTLNIHVECAVWKDYMEKLLNEENIWDQDVTCDVKEGPECIVTREEVVSACWFWSKFL